MIPPIARVAGPGDADLVTSLLSQSYTELLRAAYPPAVLKLALPVLTTANLALLSSGTYYIASIDSVPAGCCGWTSARPSTGERVDGLAHIRHFATIPSAIGKGVGRALFNRCRHEAYLLGFKRLEILAPLNAEGFYTALGCRGIHQTTVSLSGGVAFPSIVMLRDLP
ncbi:MAG: GNAT family N-acetyltransferase [Alphaproteobacteria bacterium]|nr:GNAT family N-acetyltransferase [Alphaproteobacteria bacterium]